MGKIFPSKSQFWGFWVLWWNLPNSSCHFPNHKLVFLQILYHSSVWWKITLLYFFRLNVIYFARKGPMKVQILETFECLGQNSPNSCQFWNKSFFVHHHHHSVSWVIIKGAYQSTNLVKFQVSSQKFEILHFHGIHLFKSYKASAKKVQKSSLVTLKNDKKFKKSWLVVSIWHEEFCECSPYDSEVWNFHFDGFFLSKVHTVWA